MALRAGEDETAFREAVLPRVANVLFGTKRFLPKFFGECIIYCALLLSNGNVCVLGETHNHAARVVHCCFHHSRCRPSGLGRSIAAAYKQFIKGFQQLLGLLPMRELKAIPVRIALTILYRLMIDVVERGQSLRLHSRHFLIGWWRENGVFPPNHISTASFCNAALASAIAFIASSKLGFPALCSTTTLFSPRACIPLSTAIP